MTRLNKQVTFLALILLLVSIFSCWTIYNAYASTETVTVSWDKAVVETDLAGFDLRVNGDNSTIINIPGANVREWTGSLIFCDGNNTLDMRAKDLSGQVSEWSEPCYYDPVPSAPSKVIVIKITINIH